MHGETLSLAVVSALEAAFRDLGPAGWSNPRPMSTRDDPENDLLGRWVTCYFSSGIPSELFTAPRIIPTSQEVTDRVMKSLQHVRGIRVLAVKLAHYPARGEEEACIGFRVYIDFPVP